MLRLQRLRSLATLVSILALTAGPAVANDGTAVIGIGGIQIVRDYDIRMASEDLYVSPDKISVDYVFVNESENDAERLVAFPLPELSGEEFYDSGVALPSTDMVNFVDFTVTIDGRPVAYETEIRAFSPAGLDVTARLNADGIPLNPIANATFDALLALPPEKRSEYKTLGLAEWDEQYNFAHPFWRVRVVFYWRQMFPSKTPLSVSHTYRPIAGTGFFALPEQTGATEDPYCMDSDFRAAARRMMKKSGRDYLEERSVTYVLTTGSSWHGTIGSFRLTVAKPDPSWIVSLCASGIRKTGPTTFEWSTREYIPEKDLEVLFVRQMPNE
ncbi:MAG: DUF4424 family protein [Hyphomicrobiales bacterium]|nr:DUF4424 family protein [Hyphomicrobiales bacterium]